MFSLSLIIPVLLFGHYAKSQTTYKVLNSVDPTKIIKDCGEILQASSAPMSDGVYMLNPDDRTPFQVYCDMTHGGWTVFQRRVDGSISFYRKYLMYGVGFGEFAGNFWLGNKKISRIVSQGDYELRIEMKDFKGDYAYANYDSFKLGNASTFFTLHLSGYEGNKGDAMRTHNHMPFSTYDYDNDHSDANCAMRFLGGWWYNDCMSANLNGAYNDSVNTHGIVWETWETTEMKQVTMKLRRKVANKLVGR